MVIGIIEKDHVGKKACRLRKYQVLYKLVSTNECSTGDIKVNIILKIIQPGTYNPEPGTYFALKLLAVQNQPEIV